MVNKYKDLKVEVQKLRSFKARVILIIAGALETVSKVRSQSHLKQRLFWGECVKHNNHCTKNKVFSLRISSVNVTQIRRKLKICSHLRKKSSIKNFIFCAVLPEGANWKKIIIAILPITITAIIIAILPITITAIIIAKLPITITAIIIAILSIMITTILPITIATIIIAILPITITVIISMMQLLGKAFVKSVF